MQSGGRYPTNFKNKEFLNKNFYCDHFLFLTNTILNNIRRL